MPDNRNDRETEQSETRTINPDEVMDADTAPIDMQGQIIETFLSPRDFGALDWLLQNVASQPAGFHVVLGRIAGYAVTGEERESGLKVKAGEKAPPPSFWVRGQFEGVALATGEVKTAPWLILPRSAGELLKGAFQAGAERVLLDLEIGAQATGRSIPYRWTVRAFGTTSGEAQKVVAMIRARQEARAKAQGPALVEHQPELPMTAAKVADRV
jgi:hypothetical protein